MKKYILILIMILLTLLAKAQDKRFAAFGYIDPVATKDGLNLGLGIEYQMTVVYFKAQAFAFPNLNGKKYIELTATPLGFNQHFGRDAWRTYQGLKLGVIKRDFTHPTVGVEVGLDYYFNSYNKGFYIGGGWSYDFRTDGKEEEADIKDYWRLSGLIKAGFTF